MVDQVIQLDKNYFCVRYNGDLIVGTQREIESFIRKNELDLWMESNNRFNLTPTSINRTRTANGG